MLFGRGADFWNELRGRRTPPPATSYQPSIPDKDAAETELDEADETSAPTWAAQTITGRTYVISYADTKGQMSERQVLCRRLAENGGHLYLHAHCYVRDRARTFRADRIRAMMDNATGEIYEPGMELLRLFLPNSTSAAPFHYGLNPRAFGDFNAALNVLAFMARCDGEWHDLEARAIEDFAAAYWLRAEIASPLDLAEIVRHAGRLAPDAETFWVSLQRCADHPTLSAIIRRHIAAVIDADGVHHAHELHWGREIDDYLSG